MTDYNYWNKFDENKVSDEIDSKERIQDFKDDKEKAKRLETRDIEAKIINSKKTSEILQAQDAVNALKAKGGRARRNKPTADVEELVQPAAVSVAMEVATSLSNLSECLMKLMAEVDALEVFVEKKSRHFPGYVRSLATLSEVEAFARTKKESKLLLAKIDPADTEYIQQTEDMHDELDQAHKYLFNRTAKLLALFSLSLEEYSQSADLSRLVLKGSSDRFDGSVWAMRGLAFTGMGNGYLMKLHFQSAVGQNHLFPGLDAALLAEIDRLELAHARRYLSQSGEERVAYELRHQLRSLLSRSNTKLRANSDLSSIALADIQTFVYEAEDATSSSSSALSEVTPNLSCEDFLQLFTSHIDATFVPSTGKGSKCALDIIMARFNALRGEGTLDLMGWLLLELGRQLFYEGQILYLESMYGSAETKYLAAVVFLTCFLAHVAADPDMAAPAVESTTHCERLLGSSLMNAASCRLSRNEHKSVKAKTGAAEVVAALTIGGLAGLSTAQLARRGAEYCGGTLLARLKLVHVLEQTRQFDEASAVLDAMSQHVAADELSSDGFVSPAALAGVDYAFQRSQQFLTGCEEPSAETHRALSREEWLGLIAVQRSTVEYKRGKLLLA